MDPNIFLGAKFFYGTKKFSHPKQSICPQKIFWIQQNLRPQNILDPKKIFDPKTVLSQKKFEHKNIMGLKNVLTPKIFWSTKFGTLKLCNKNILFDIFTPKNYGRKIFSAPEFLDTKKLLCLKIYTFKGDSPSISRLVH